MRLEIDPAWIGNTWGLTEVRLGRRLGDNDVHEVESAEGRYILKIAGSWTTREAAAATTGLLAFLRTSGHAWAPRLVPPVAGERFREHEGRFAYLMERCSGAHVQG